MLNPTRSACVDKPASRHGRASSTASRPRVARTPRPPVPDDLAFFRRQTRLENRILAADERGDTQKADALQREYEELLRSRYGIKAA